MRAAVLAMVAVVFWPLWADAILVGLTEDQVKEAVTHGVASYDVLRKEKKPADNLDPDYVVDLGPDAGQAYLFTEFSTLALETRRYLAIGEKMKDEAIARVMASAKGKLVFLVTVVGPKRDFLRHYKVTLVQGETMHKPAESDVHRGSKVEGAGDRHRAPGIYSFDAKALDPSSPATLVVSDGGERELKFSFDLSRLR
jgi:hypothetical protein